MASTTSVTPTCATANRELSPRMRVGSGDAAVQPGRRGDRSERVQRCALCRHTRSLAGPPRTCPPPRSADEPLGTDCLRKRAPCAEPEAPCTPHRAPGKRAEKGGQRAVPGPACALGPHCEPSWPQPGRFAREAAPLRSPGAASGRKTAAMGLTSARAWIWCCTIGLLAKSTSGLGLLRVRGRSRVPKPPTRIKAFMVQRSRGGLLGGGR